MKKRFYFLGALILVMTCFLSCGYAADKEVRRDTVTMATYREPKSLIPYGANDTGSGPVCSLIYETLLRFNEKMELEPCLATEWEKIDDTHFRFKLRDDVYFHNGEKLTPEDVLYTFSQSTTSAATASTLGPVDVANSIIEGDSSIILALKEPFAPFLNTVALDISGIVNKKNMEKDPQGYAQNPIGTGPFVFKSWKPGDNLQLVANNHWWGGSINFEKLVIRLIPEAMTRTIEVETGGVDIALVVVGDAVSLEDNPNVNVIRQPILNVSYLSYNCARTPFNDLKVRQAISCAIDIDAIVKTASFGLAQRSKSAIAPAVWGYYDAGVPYGYNVEKSKKLLAESSQPNGFSTTLLCTTGDVSVAEMIQAYLAQIGITVKIEAVDFAKWLDSLVNGRQEMYLGGWTVPSADAAEGFSAFHSANYGAGGNRSFYTNKDLDVLLDSATKEMDTSKRRALYKQIQEILAEECVYVHTYVGQIYIAANKDVQGLVTMPTQNLGYHLLTFTK
jgi:peptide/nickel transport system substrate-binding protein